jgi:hypothetical protein
MEEEKGETGAFYEMLTEGALRALSAPTVAIVASWVWHTFAGQLAQLASAA